MRGSHKLKIVKVLRVSRACVSLNIMEDEGMQLDIASNPSITHSIIHSLPQCQHRAGMGDGHLLQALYETLL